MLLDLRLPVVDGLEVLAALRRHERTRDAHVLILTSSEDPPDQEVRTRLGVLAGLGNPLDLGDLQQALAKLPGAPEEPGATDRTVHGCRSLKSPQRVSGSTRCS